MVETPDGSKLLLSLPLMSASVLAKSDVIRAEIRVLPQEALATLFTK